jgi:pimeloyl-ACP methyl ester carboxylesterase
MFVLLTALTTSLDHPRSAFHVTENTSLSFNQLIDHSGASQEKFEQHYYANFSVSADNNTAVLYIGGESDGFGQPGEKSTTFGFAKQLKGILFVLEHRYFGRSQPFPNAMTTENLKYLTVDQAVEDLASFQQWAMKHYNLPSACKWLLVGGSYPGLLAAYARAKHPELFHAAISSSGVVYATNNYKEFDEQIAISLGQSCAAAARKVRQQADELLETNPEFLLNLFGMKDLEKKNFPLVLGEIFSLGPQYGDRKRLCAALEESTLTGSSPLVRLAKYTKEIFGPSYAGDDIIGTYSDKEMHNTTKDMNGARAWMWMTCNELAYWQVAPGRLSLRSPKVNQQFFQDQCKAIFDQDMPIPDTQAFNDKWIPLLKKTSRIYYLTSSQDPWTPTCFTDDDTVGPDCYVHTIIGEEAGHCSDLSSPKPTDQADLIRTRAHVKYVIQKWMDEKIEE